MDIVGRVGWWQRKKPMRLARKTDRPLVIRRALSLVHLSRGWSVIHVAEWMGAARSTIYTWAAWFREGGIAGLTVKRRGSVRRTMTAKVLGALATMLDKSPASFGYLRTRWSSELLAKDLLQQISVFVNSWCRRGRQEANPKPGKNCKAYIAGALHARSGRVV